MNEYVHDASDQDVLGLIVECTGGERDSASTKYTLATFNMLRRISDFDTPESYEPEEHLNQPSLIAQIPYDIPQPSKNQNNNGKSINLSYTINLNLPATKDIEVFNAIFKSLKEHLLES